MILSRNGKQLAARHEAADLQRKYVTRLPRKPYRAQNSHKIKIKKTPVEKKVVADQRAERHEQMADALAAARDKVADEARKMQAEFGLHDEKYYQHQILQQARTETGQRKTNRWNAYLKNELEKLNAELPPGTPRFSSTGEMGSQIAERWKAMSAEEKVEVTKDLVKELDDAKEMRTLSVQSVPVNVFHDVRATMGTIFEQLRRLHARTGLEIAVVSVRSDRAQFVPPMTFATSTRVYDFFQVTTGNTLDDLACSLEAYCLSGVSGLVERSIDVIQGLQSRASALISQRLGQVTQHTASKMFYAGFADHITTRFGVVIENWPLPHFTAPSAMRTRLELTTLINAWETDVTRFRKISKPEWDQWELQQKDPDGPVIVRAVTVAGFIPSSSPGTVSTAGVATGTPSAAPGMPPPLASGSGAVASGSSRNAEQASNDLVLPTVKPRKRRSDNGKTHKKRKGNASGTTDGEIPRSAHPARHPAAPPSSTALDHAEGAASGVHGITPQTLCATQATALAAAAPTSFLLGSMASAMGPASGYDPRVGYMAPTSSFAVSPHAGPLPFIAGLTPNPPGSTAPTAPTAPPPLTFHFPPSQPSVDIMPDSPFVNAGLPVQHNSAFPGGLHEWHMHPHFAIDPALTGGAHAIDPVLTGGAHASITTPSDAFSMQQSPQESMPQRGEDDHALTGPGLREIQFIPYNGETTQSGRGRGRGGHRGCVRVHGG